MPETTTHSPEAAAQAVDEEPAVPPVHERASAVARRVDELIRKHDRDLVALRRRIHSRPELGWSEHETTDLLMERLQAAGLEPRRLDPTGVIVDIGAEPRPAKPGRIALRADIDALPIPEETGLDFASQIPGRAHACGHDLHTAALFGATLALAELERAGELQVGVRCIFQPAEEVQPGGAKTVIAQGGVAGVARIYALHCAPRVTLGTIGSRIGPITAAGDTLTLTVSADGGHTSRPHHTGDVIAALSHLATGLPAVLGRRTDPRAAVSLTWGAIEAGSAANAMPASGTLTGTIRCLHTGVWAELEQLVEHAAHHLAAPFGVELGIDHVKGIPPVDNEESAVRCLDAAVKDQIGPGAVELTDQSLGGEDFAWYLREVPGAMVRLGTRTPGGPNHDLHRGDAVFDERAIGIGARVLARTALLTGEELSG